MKIETKYSVGDKVYSPINGRPTMVDIVGIQVYIKQKEVFEIYTIKHKKIALNVSVGSIYPNIADCVNNERL